MNVCFFEKFLKIVLQAIYRKSFFAVSLEGCFERRMASMYTVRSLNVLYTVQGLNAYSAIPERYTFNVYNTKPECIQYEV